MGRGLPVSCAHWPSQRLRQKPSLRKPGGMAGAASWGGAWRPLPCPAAPVFQVAERRLAAAAATSCPCGAPALTKPTALRSSAQLVFSLHTSAGAPGSRVRSARGSQAGTPRSARARTVLWTVGGHRDEPTTAAAPLRTRPATRGAQVACARSGHGVPGRAAPVGLGQLAAAPAVQQVRTDRLPASQQRLRLPAQPLLPA